MPSMKSYSLFFFFTAVSAQYRLKNAEQAIKVKDYTSAITGLDTIIQNRSNYSDKDLAKAHYLRGLSYFEITTDVNLLKAQPSAFSKCYHDFKMVKQLDHKNIWETNILQNLATLKPTVTQNSIKLLQNLYAQYLSPKLRSKEANLAQGLIEILIDLEPSNYINYDFRGQVKLANMDSLAAMMDFQNSIKLYQSNPPVIPDFFMAYAYYRSALIQREVLAYEDQTLSTLQAGNRFLEKERKRVGTLSQKQQSQYQKALGDLQNFELDLYYQTPLNSQSVLRKFELALRNDPNNYANRCAYAGLLEQTMPEKAIAQYQEAIKIDPTKKQAYYNIGVIFINLSINSLKGYSAEGDLIEREIQANQIAKKALPYLEEAHKIDPNDRALLKTIIDLSLKINDLIKYQQYKTVRDQNKIKY